MRNELSLAAAQFDGAAQAKGKHEHWCQHSGHRGASVRLMAFDSLERRTRRPIRAITEPFLGLARVSRDSFPPADWPPGWLRDHDQSEKRLRAESEKCSSRRAIYTDNPITVNRSSATRDTDHGAISPSEARPRRARWRWVE